MNNQKKQNRLRKIKSMVVLLLLLFTSQIAVAQDVSATERQALIDLYNATDGPNWTNSTNWNTSALVTDWFGVTVTNDVVTSISLSNNNLVGSIPSQLGNLTNLTSINFQRNQLTGLIPNTFGQLNNLRTLTLSFNQLSGSIPTELGELTNLTRLDLRINQLSGTIPIEFGQLTNLLSLYLNNNELTGSIPVELGLLSNLQFLYLEGNQLSGNIPIELGQLTNLTHLYLDFNELSGTIPPTFNQLVNLQDLRLDGNQLSGTIPSQISLFTNLRLLYFSANNFVFSDFESEHITYQTNLTTSYFFSPQSKVDATEALSVAEGGSITLTSTALTSANNTYQWYKDGVAIAGATNKDYVISSAVSADGGVYHFLANNTIVTGLELERNPITLTIDAPVCGVSAAEKQALLDLYNATDGANWTNNTNWNTAAPVCDWFGVTVVGETVTELKLDQNLLTGTIPSELGNLLNLESLDLFSNNLSGSIPSELGNLTNLIYLALSANNLTGSIPIELGNLTNLNELILNSNQLSGDIPSGLTSLTRFLAFQNNIFVFKDFETEHLTYINNISNYRYTPQAKVDLTESLSVAENGSITLTSTVLTSTNNTYQWYKDGVAIAGATSKDYVISNALPADAGVYHFLANNTIVTGLELERNPITLTIDAPVCGVSAAEKQALLDLYNATDGANWTNVWDIVNTEPCDWYGVTVTNDVVTSISLSNNNLVGSIPVSLDQLANLQIISLGNNELSGSIPSQLGNLTNLTSINFQRNQLTGLIPNTFGQLSNLTTLILSFNQFSGRIPVGLGLLNNLTRLDLRINQLSGTIPIEFGQLTNLLSLYLNNNELTGSIPVELGLLSNLQFLYLEGNQLSGNIPIELGQLTNLTHLYLDFNELSGTIPPTFNQLVNLQDLRLDGNQLSGTIPSQISLFTNLRLLYFSANNFVFSDFESEHITYQTNLTTSYFFSPQSKVDATEALSVAEGGSITLTSTALTSANNTYQWYKDGVAIAGATNKDYVISSAVSADGGVYHFLANNTIVTGLELERNPITLTIDAPVCGVSAAEKQALLDLYNATDGANWTNTLANNQPWDTNIPVCDWFGVSITNDNVIGLNLNDNNLVGSIPSELSNLLQLSSILLANNQLTGNIPPELGDLLQLSTLFLANNQLSGSIPTELGNLLNLRSLYISGNQLTGSIPPELGNLSNLRTIILSNNQLSGEIPSGLGALPNLLTLRLQENQLSGNIPAALSNSASLQVFEFEINNFIFNNFEAEHLTYQANLVIYSFGPQAKVDLTEALSVAEGGSITLTSTVLTSTNNTYQWYKDGVAIAGATSKDYVISSALPADAGVYHFLANNTVVTGLELERNPITLTIDAPVCGVSAAEKQALLDLYNATDGANWTNTLANNQPWDTNLPVCDWFGVTVVDGNVTKLELNINGLTGSLSSSIGQLVNLEELSFNGNSIIGNIPSEITQLSSLKFLTLSSNQLTGSIPIEIGQLSFLQRLILGQNGLTGPIPSSLGQLTNLTTLQLQNNSFLGNIPPELGLISTLVNLSLYNNQLTGTLPPELGSLSNLSTLVIDVNSLTGNIPSEYGQLSSLRQFTMGRNQLSGILPNELGQLSELRIFSILDNSFSGVIPSGLKNLPLFSDFYFEENNFIFSDLENDFVALQTILTNSSYSPQAKVDLTENLAIAAGQSITLSSNVLTSPNNTYQWYKDGVAIVGETNRDLVINPALPSDAGVYHFLANNTVVTGLELERNPITLTIDPYQNLVQRFCSVDGTFSVADLLPAITGGSPLWYLTETGGTPIDIDTELVNERLYWQDTTNGLSQRIAIIVYIDQDRPIGEATQFFDFNLDPRVEEIRVFGSQMGAEIQWYDTANSEDVLSPNTLLVDGETYYALQQGGLCRLEVTVFGLNQYFCTVNGTSPIVNDLPPSSNDGSILWFATETGGTSLDLNTPLTSGVYWKGTSNAISEQRIAVNVFIDLTRIISDPELFFDFTTTPTLNDISLTTISNGDERVAWYDTATSTEELPIDTPLVDGESYFVGFAGLCKLEITVFDSNAVNDCIDILYDTVDGSFEISSGALNNGRNGDLGGTGWTVSQGSPDTFLTPATDSADLYLLYNFNTSPNGGKCAGALRVGNTTESFYVDMTGLMVDETYIVEFYQANATNLLIPQLVEEANGSWNVSFGSESLISQPIQAPINSPIWERASLEFTVTNASQRIEFAAASSATDVNNAYPVYMLIDGIRIYKKPNRADTTACYDIDIQSFCSSDIEPTIADLVSPLSGTTLWYSEPVGGIQYDATEEIVGFSSYFVWADNGSGDPRVPVEVIFDLGAPVGNDYQEFDVLDNPTIASLQVVGNNITWYDSTTSTVPLATTTALVNDTIYYAAQDNNSCRLDVEVFIGIPSPIGPGSQEFCSSENPTIANLAMEVTNTSYSLEWYNAETDGSIYNSTDPLVDGTTYYVVQTDGTNSTEERLPVFVSIIDVEAQANLYERDIAVAQGETIATLTNFFRLDSAILWYDVSNGGTAYRNIDELVEGETYYAQIGEGLCSALEVLAVTVHIEEVVVPELITCIKFVPQPGNEYVISGWVRENTLSGTPSEVGNFSDVSDVFVSLLEYLKDKVLLQESIPEVYVLRFDPNAPNVDALLPYIKNATSKNVTIYNFQLEKENTNGINRTIGFSFSLDPDKTYKFTYITPKVRLSVAPFYNSVLDYHYPMLNNNATIDITFKDVSVCGTDFCINSDFKIGEMSSVLRTTLTNVLSENSTLSGIESSVQFFTYQDDPGYQVMEYLNTSIELTYKDIDGAVIPLESDKVIFRPKGSVIDGWQRISSSFTIPTEAANITITLKNEGDALNAYFDDVRMHPFNSNMKSFVYDPITQRLQAELDENNYATFYEYDTEGGLVRVKKETERGVYTIQETRSGNSKLINK